MNESQVKGKAKDATGKAQEKVGELAGSEEQKAKGLKKQVEGSAQEAAGDVEELVKDSTTKKAR